MFFAPQIPAREPRSLTSLQQLWETVMLARDDYAINGATFRVTALDIACEFSSPTITPGTGTALRHNRCSHGSAKELKLVLKLLLTSWTCLLPFSIYILCLSSYIPSIFTLSFLLPAFFPFLPPDLPFLSSTSPFLISFQPFYSLIFLFLPSFLSLFSLRCL